MRHVKVLFGVLIAVMAVGLATSAAAFAEKKVLPSEGVTFTATSGTGKFVSKNGLTVNGKSDKGSGSFTSDTLGEFTVTFEGTTGTLGVKCTGLSDTEGNITVSGIFHVVELLNGKAGIAFLINPVHFSCAGILSSVRGCVVGSLTKESGTTTEIILKQVSTGVNEITDYVGNSSCILETSTSEGKFEQSSQTSTESVTFSTSVEVMS